MIGFQIKRTIVLGLKSLWLHLLRSALTLIGMMLGVCAVIVMLAIGEGASYEAQEQIKQLGSTNIILRSVKPQEAQEEVNGRRTLPIYGLTYTDAERIQSTIPDVQVTVSARRIRKRLRYHTRTADTEMLGTVPWYTDVLKREVARGRFIATSDIVRKATVCVLEPDVAEKLFPLEDPLGKNVRVEEYYYRVVGLMAPRTRIGNKEAASELAAQRAGMYIPLSTASTRYGEILVERESGSFLAERVELHELVVQMDDISTVLPTAEALRMLLEQSHEKDDYEIIVPLERLEVAQQVKRTFNFVLGSIAAISLLVGGIGIMNIMLATVTERTREIGIRRALGAKKRHIIMQFLTETVLLSATGGLIGVLFGLTIPFAIERLAGMKTIVVLWSPLLAFTISAAAGIIFGIYPAWRAATMNPIEALRHE